MAWRICGVMLLLLLIGHGAAAQSNVPIVSGGAGFLGSTAAGSNVFQPVIAPVLAVPLGERWLIEARADLREVVFQTGPSGSYRHEFFPTWEYGQLDFNASSHLTITVGRFLTPFNMYNERFTPIWIRNFQDAPIIFPIGTRTSGSSDGLMARGLLVSNSSFQLNYSAYFSTLSTNSETEAGRAAGGRAGIFLPGNRLELGVSFQRFLQARRMNAVGGYLSWQPESVPLDLRAEYAHSPGGHGYWLEGAYRFSRHGATDSLFGRLQAIARMQQFFRLKPSSGDSLPRRDTNRVDFGWNYYLPHEVRLNASYGRELTPSGNFNIWDFGVTYRLLFPLFPGGQ